MKLTRVSSRILDGGSPRYALSAWNDKKIICDSLRDALTLRKLLHLGFHNIL